MKIGVDRRTREFHDDPAAERAVREGRLPLARREAAVALGLARVESGRCYLREDFASVHRWAEGQGYAPQQIRRLLALGRALRDVPGLFGKVRRGQVAAESAAWVGKLLREPKLRFTEEQRAELVRKAETTPPDEFRKACETAIEEARQGRPCHTLRLLVTKEAKDGFAKARQMMSKGLHRPLTEGQTFGRLVDDWLGAHDPDRRQSPRPPRRGRGKQGGARGTTGAAEAGGAGAGSGTGARPGPRDGAGPADSTGSPPGGPARRSRYVSRRTEHVLWRRSGGKCEICGVRPAEVRIHVRVPFARGGTQGADELAYACHECHFFQELGVWQFAGFDETGRMRWTHHPERLPPPGPGLGRPGRGGGLGGPSRGGSTPADGGGSPPEGRGPADGVEPAGGASEVRERAPPYLLGAT